MDADKMDGQQVIIPVQQATVTFYGRELIAVRLPDGRIAAVLRWLCEGMGLDANGQLQRIRRKAALRDDLVTVRVATAGGPQDMPALALHGLPGWLYGIDETRVRSREASDAVVLFQREATDVLYRHFAERPRELAAPRDLVTSAPVERPEKPAQDAEPLLWADYHERMAEWLRWQADVSAWRQGVDAWRGSVEDRLESVEEVTRLVPEILERLGPETLSPEHQRTVQGLVKRLHELGGYAYATVYAELGEHFHVARYDQIPEGRWQEVATWLQRRIDAAEKRPRRQP